MKRLLNLLPVLSVLLAGCTGKNAETITLPGISERYDRLDCGLTIHSLVAGKPGKPPLILLHGYPTNAYLWRQVMQELKDHFVIYAPDLPGFGKSSKPLDADYDLAFFNTFLKDYFAALGIKKAHLAAHDLGAMAGLGFVSEHEDMIDKLVITDTLPYSDFSEDTQKFYKFATSRVWSQVLLFKPLFSSSFFKDKTLVYNAKAFGPEIVENYRLAWSKDEESKIVFSRVLKAPAHKITVPREELRKITVPTLIMWGENDYAMGPELGKKLNGDIENSKLIIIPRCGHFVPEEQPVQAARHILTFLSTPLEDRDS